MKQIHKGDFITGFPFNIMRDTLRRARDVTNHALYFPTCSPILQIVHIVYNDFPRLERGEKAYQTLTN
uniref:SFRICE_016028 n=1 Tax=Spodoptera frugiperda TaxID=7108 RepID=A0A2H1W6C0_SPOFR